MGNNNLVFTMQAISVVVLVLYTTCTWGLSNKKGSLEESKIVGGRTVTIEKYLFMVHLQVFTFSTLDRLCDGTILNAKFVLSSGHCLSGSTSVRMSLGSQHASGKVHYTSTVHYLHPSFSDSTRDYDVSLIQTHIVLDGVNAKPVRLPAAGAPVAAKALLDVVGWGSTNATNMTGVSNDLKAVSVPVVDFNTCKSTYVDQITTRMFCAGDMVLGGKDACYNDGGGPALNAAGVQVGIVSWGKGCGEKDFPGVYTDVAAVRPWLASVIGF